MRSRRDIHGQVHLTKLLWSSILILLSTSPLASADGPRPMTPIDMLEVPRLGDPRLSPDGTQLLYVLGTADWEANKMKRHIWRFEVGDGGPVQLTNGEKGENSPRWSPDGESIAFLAKRGDNKEDQIYLLSNHGGEALQLSSHETSVQDIAWSPDGRFLYFLAKDPKTEEEKERDKAKDDVFAFDENYKQRHLWRLSLDEKNSQIGRAHV